MTYPLPLPLNVDTTDWAADADKGTAEHIAWHQELHRGGGTLDRVHVSAVPVGSDPTTNTNYGTDFVVGPAAAVLGTRDFSIGPYARLTTAATIGDVASERWPISLNPITHGSVLFRFTLNTTTAVRFFAGVAAYNTNFDSDTLPTTSGTFYSAHAGIQFSTVRGDTTFQWTTAGDDANGQTRAASAIAPSTTYRLAVSYVAHRIYMSLSNSSGSVYETYQHDLATLSSTSLRPTIALVTQEAVAKNCNRWFYHASWRP